MQITQLNVYPVKSARGLTLSETAISAEGLPGDRRAMLVDPSGQFITQRELPAIATLNVAPEAGGYRLSIEGKGDVLALPSSSRLDVTVWKSTVDAALASDEANRTLSQWLGQEMKLAFFDDQSKRLANAEWTGNETPVTFADGYQILVATTASLDALNADMTAHGEDSVGMERFRPNIVLETDDAWVEDRWAAIEINGIRFDLVKPCTRCIMTTQDQKTGSRDVPSPMKAMGRIRMSADRRVPGVLFGWNLTPRGKGTIRLGDVAKVVEWRDEAWPLKRRG